MPTQFIISYSISKGHLAKEFFFSNFKTSVKCLYICKFEIVCCFWVIKHMSLYFSEKYIDSLEVKNAANNLDPQQRRLNTRHEKY